MMKSKYDTITTTTLEEIRDYLVYVLENRRATLDLNCIDKHNFHTDDSVLETKIYREGYGAGYCELLDDLISLIKDGDMDVIPRWGINQAP